MGVLGFWVDSLLSALGGVFGEPEVAGAWFASVGTTIQATRELREYVLTGRLNRDAWAWIFLAVGAALLYVSAMAPGSGWGAAAVLLPVTLILGWYVGRVIDRVGR